MAWGCLRLRPSAGPGWAVGSSCALGWRLAPVPGTWPGSPSAAAAVALPSQEHCGSPDVLEQIYRCNPILRYTSSPLYAPLLPFPYGSLDQSGEGQRGAQSLVPLPGLAGVTAGRCAGWAGAGLGPGQPWVWVQCLAAGGGSLRGC